MRGGPFYVMKRSLFFFLFLSVPLSAADKPVDLVRYRQSVMKAMGSHMNAASLIVKKLVSDRSHLPGHAAAIRELGTGLAAYFPPGSGPDKVKTGAMMAIWQKLPEFRVAAEEFHGEAVKLAEVSKHGDAKAFDAQFARVGAACNSCHDRFRIQDAD